MIFLKLVNLSKEKLGCFGCKSFGFPLYSNVNYQYCYWYKVVSQIGEHMSYGGSAGGSSSRGSQGSDKPPDAEYEEVKK